MILRRSKPLQIAELIGSILVLLGFWRVLAFFLENGYLGPPFVFDIGDTFMDWFHTAYWAHHGGAYSFWRTIYLPMSFIITGLFSNPQCYHNAQYDARDCDWIGYVVIVMMYLGCVAVSWIALRRRDPSTAIYRVIALGLGGPLLFALERGNLVMIAYIGFVMVYGGLVRSTWAVALTSGLLANMKVYMVFPVVAMAIKREWRLVELCALASLALYLVTFGILGEGNPVEIISNLQNWFGFRLGAVWDEVLYTTTYKPFLQLDTYQYPIRDYLYEGYVDLALKVIQYYWILSRGVCLLILGLAWLYPRAVTINRLVFFILMQSFIGQNPGGYGIAFIVFLVFMETRRNFAVMLSLFCCYLMSVPGDWTLTKIFEFERVSWLSQKSVLSDYVLPLGALVRPGIIAVVLWALAIDSLIDLQRAIRSDPPSFGLLESRWNEPAGGSPSLPVAPAGAGS